MNCSKLQSRSQEKSTLKSWENSAGCRAAGAKTIHSIGKSCQSRTTSMTITTVTIPVIRNSRFLHGCDVPFPDFAGAQTSGSRSSVLSGGIGAVDRKDSSNATKSGAGRYLGHVCPLAWELVFLGTTRWGVHTGNHLLRATTGVGARDDLVRSASDVGARGELVRSATEVHAVNSGLRSTTDVADAAILCDTAACRRL